MKRSAMVMPLILVVLVTLGGLGILALRLLDASKSPLRRDMVSTLVTNAAMDGLARAEKWLLQRSPVPLKGAGIVALEPTGSADDLLIDLPEDIASSFRDGVQVHTRVYWAYYRCDADFATFRNHWQYPVNLAASRGSVVEAEDSGGFDGRAYVVRVRAELDGLSDMQETLVVLEP